MAYTSCLTGCRSASQNDSPAPSLHAKVKVLPILAENFPKTEISWQKNAPKSAKDQFTKLFRLNSRAIRAGAKINYKMS